MVQVVVYQVEKDLLCVAFLSGDQGNSCWPVFEAPGRFPAEALNGHAPRNWETKQSYIQHRSLNLTKSKGIMHTPLNMQRDADVLLHLPSQAPLYNVSFVPSLLRFDTESGHLFFTVIMARHDDPRNLELWSL